MTGKISLTASMRSNLLSLQNISRQVSSTQNKLATGNKVNSAIDNPSSYYTARSLTNRANDLDSLLDSMGQAVQTIKTATTALETGATFLEQAAAVATSALETNTIPPKAFFEEKVGANGAVVTTAQELKDAVAAGKETICVYGQIDLGAIDSAIILNNQKLVGIGYFGDFDAELEKFSAITAISSQKIDCIKMLDSSFSDISLSYTNSYHEREYAAITGIGGNNIVRNANIILSKATYNFAAAIWNDASSSNMLLQGNVNIKSNGLGAFGKITVDNNAILQIKTSSFAFVSGVQIRAGAKIFADSSELYHFYLNRGISVEKGAQLYNKQSLFAEFESYSNHEISEGVKIGLGDKFYETTAKFTNHAKMTINSNNIVNIMRVKENKPFEISTYKSQKQKINNNENKQYSEILQQYDTLVKDSSYKGVNLLKKDKLNVRFNENGNADLNVNGKDMSAGSLGLNTVDWQNQGDIAQSLKEIVGALKSIRAFTAELGNNYSIITSRQDFTENLINILTEGADKLTLADMNEESANMLALQTRQQLAINSLSLASQAAQAVMKLF